MVENRDPRKVVQSYLAGYRAAPHKTTGKSPYELMFNRLMQTKLPRLIKNNTELDAVVRAKHDDEKAKQNLYSDKKRKAKEKMIKLGDNILIQKKKTSVTPPWDPQPFEVVDIQGSKIVGQRGEEVKVRAKNNIKVVKERPEYLQVKKRKESREREEDTDEWEVDMEKIRVLSRWSTPGPSGSPPYSPSSASTRSPR